MWVKQELRLEHFAQSFSAGRLGRLWFPNGRAFEPHGQRFENGEILPFNVHLGDLFKLMTDWRVDGHEVPPEDIVAVVAFGSAVRVPGTHEVKSARRRFLIAGPMTERVQVVPIQPKDADFLVITRRNLIRERVLVPVSLETYDCGTWIQRGGIHLTNRGAEQVIAGVSDGDTISINALKNGVVLLADGDFADVRSRANTQCVNPYEASWEEDDRGRLFGRIGTSTSAA